MHENELITVKLSFDAKDPCGLRFLDPDGKDVTFVSASDYHGLVAIGWLRASHRKTDPEKSTFYRPWHTHDEKRPLTPGDYELEDKSLWTVDTQLQNCLEGQGGLYAYQ